MQRALGRTLAFAVAFLAISACNDDNGVSSVTPPPVPTVISATGDITAKVVEYRALLGDPSNGGTTGEQPAGRGIRRPSRRSEEHTSELQSQSNLVCRLLL